MLKASAPPYAEWMTASIMQKLLSKDSCSSGSEVIVKRISGLLNASPPSTFGMFLYELFTQLQSRPITANQRSVMCACLQETSNMIKEVQCRYQAMAVFERLVNFPGSLITKLPIDGAIRMAVCATGSKFCAEATALLDNELLPNVSSDFYESIDDDLLFDLISLPLKNVEIPNVRERPIVFIRKFTPSVKLDLAAKTTVNVQSEPSLYDAVLESDSRSLTSPAQLQRLFDFFSEFNEIHTAAFVSAICSPKCGFRSYFSKLEETQRDRIVDLFRDSFLERNIDLSKVVGVIDKIPADPLDNEGCGLLFSVLQGLMKDSQVPIKPFLGPWQNIRVQLQFISYIASTSIPGMNTTADVKIANLYEYTSGTVIPNNCWINLDFIECTMALAEHYPREVSSLYHTAMEKFNIPMMLAFSQLPVPTSSVFKKIYIDVMGYVLQARHTFQAFNFIWDANPSFAKWIYNSYYAQSPNRINGILDSAGSHLNDLLLSDDLDFIVDLAFHASLRSMLSIDEFMKQIVTRFSDSVLPKVLEFVKTMVLDSNLSPALLSTSLNTMFAYFWDVFENLSGDMKLLVNTIYSICDSSVPNIKQLPFAQSLPSIKTPEVKEAASEYFSKFLSDQLSVTQFVQLFHQLRVNSQTIFHSMEHFLLMELNYIGQHSVKNIEKLGQLVGNMVHENLFFDKQLKSIFGTFAKSFDTTVNSPMYRFTIAALRICYTKLTAVPQYVFSLLQEPLFKNSQPKLYEKVRKLSSNLANPIQVAKSTTFVLHHKLKRFEKLPTPPPRVCKSIQQISADPRQLQSILTLHSSYVDWLALHLVTLIQDHPTKLGSLLPHLLSSDSFEKSVIHAAIFEAITLITSPKFTTYEGGFARRRISILGRLIGELTLARNRVLPGNLLDLKRLLLYSFSQGKLFGVIPFVGAVLCSASPIFNPPNPYTSAILQVLASISTTDLLKLHIKSQISQIFAHFKVNPCQLKTLALVPDVRENNFDFVTTPFCLSYILSVGDIDRIIQFDENVFSTLSAQHLLITDPPSTSTCSKEEMRTSVTNGILGFLKSEGSTLAKVAAATAYELIQKDFIISTNSEAMFETAATLTKQLAAGLTLCIVCQKLQRNVVHNLQRQFTKEEYDWVAAIIQVNHNWISQLFHDIVHLKAWKQVQQKLEQLEEQKKNQGPRYMESIAHHKKTQAFIPPILQPCESGITPQHQVIYQDLAQIALSPAEIALPDASGEKGVSVKSNTDYDKIFNQLTALVTNEASQNVQLTDPLQEDSVFSGIIADCLLVNPTFELFLSVLRGMMKYMAKVTHTINDKVYGSLLRQTVGCVPPAYITRAREYVIQWLRTSIPSVALLCVFLEVKLVTTTQLDQFFFDNLNRHPFNYKLFVLAIRFLHHTLVVSKEVQPSDMISSLSLIAGTSLNILEQPTPQQQSFVEDLRRILDAMDVPLDILSHESKLESLPTFDPSEDIESGVVSEITETFNQLKEILNNDSGDSIILPLLKKACSFGKDFFILAFFSGDSADIKNVLEYLGTKNMIQSEWSAISSAISHCVSRNSKVLKMDMTKYYTVMVSLASMVRSTQELLLEYASLLHDMRPLAMPAFAFSWIQLATDKHFVGALLSGRQAEARWNAMTTILCDFICAVVYCNEIQPPSVFDTLYKSLLRVILTLVHDYPDFVSWAAPELIILLPFSFTQLHNIILSATPSNITVTPIKQALASIHTVPGIASFVPWQQPMKQLTDELEMATAIKNEAAFGELAAQLAKRIGTGAILSFIIHMTNLLLPQLSPSQIRKAESTHIYFVLSRLVERFEGNPDAIVVLVNALLDQLRHQCATTLFFEQALLCMFKTDHQIARNTQVTLSQIILRAVMERMVTPAPHPWGLTLLTHELLQNKEISVWNLPFVRSNEIVSKFLTTTAKNLGIDIN